MGIGFISHASAKFALEASRVREVAVSEIQIRRKICMVRNVTQPISRPAEFFWGIVNKPENEIYISRLEH